MTSANTDSWARDHVADANPDLPRKRERLSEEKDDASPLATDDSVLVEALPLEDDGAGNSYHNAIQLHDESAMEAFSADFDLEPGCNVIPVKQLHHLIDCLRQGVPLQPNHMDNFCRWLQSHLVLTREMQDRWHYAYLDDEREFFARLAVFGRDFLAYAGDLFDYKQMQQYGVDYLGQSLYGLWPAIGELAIRILRFLPGVVDGMFARRDSGQAPKTRQQLDDICYVEILAKTMTLNKAASMDFFRNHFSYKPKGHAIKLKEEFQRDPSLIAVLLELLQKLVQNHREISNSWDGIDAILRILHSLDLLRIEDLHVVIGVIHHNIMPLICEKHPRALPEGFHDFIIHMAGIVVEKLSLNSDDQAAAALYARYITSDHDALLSELAEDEPIAAKLQHICEGDKDLLAQLLTTAWSLQSLKSFIYSDIMDVRTCGIMSLGKTFVQLHKLHSSSPEQFEHPVLQYVARFVRLNEVTKYIFGPNSHASLVHHSGNIIGFLAATKAYTHLETDIIWHACTSSVEVEFAKASLAVLSEICRYMDLDQLLYVANKYVDTPPSKLGNDAVDSLSELFAKVQLKNDSSLDQGHRLATAFISINVMMKADEAESNGSLSRLRETAKQELRRFTNPAYNAHDRVEIYLRCAPHIVKSSGQASTAVDIIVLFLQGTVSKREAEHLLEALPVQGAIDEMGRFLESCRAGASSSGIAQIAAIELRLELIVRLLSLPIVDLSAEDLSRFFKYAVGDEALNNEARDRAWRLLMHMLDTNESEDVASDMLERFLAKEIAGLPLDFVTPELIKICGIHLQNHLLCSESPADYSSALHTPIWQKLVLAAESADNLLVRQQAAQMICQVLFGNTNQQQKGTSATRCHAEFARQQIDRIREEFQKTTDSGTGSICQKLGLLDAVLSQSRTFVESSAVDLQANINLASEPADVTSKYTLQIHGTGQTQPKTLVLRAKGSNKLSELASMLPNATGAAENRVLFRGKEFELKVDGETTLADLGIPEEAIIPICPRHTSDSDLGLVLTSPGAVEHEVLEQYSELEKLLDGPDDVACQAYMFLTKVRPPIQTRRHVAARQTPVLELCPLDKPWRCAFTFHVLKTNLKDYARIGVADEAFILQGLRLHLAVITDSERPVQPDVMIWALDCMLEFLLEKPQTSSIAHPIEDPTRYASRMVELVLFAVELSPSSNGGHQRFNLASLAFRALLQAFRRQSSVWLSFSNDPNATQIIKQSMFHAEPGFAQLAVETISTSCRDEDSGPEVADFFMKALLEILPQARDRADRAKPYFDLVTQVLLSNGTLRVDEARVRDITDTLVNSLWTYNHIESVDLPIADTVMAGLLRLLTETVNVLKSFKRPLELDHLAAKLFTTLLFPPYRELSSHPLVHQTSRKLALDLVKATCEGLEEFNELLDGTLHALQDASDDPSSQYPGRATWLRPAVSCSGLPNLGMTCYMNSLLQQLFANVQFRKFLFEVPIVNSQEQALLYQVQLLYANMQSSYSQVQTGDLARVLNIQTDSQEDVHGFYEDFLTRLESEMPDATWKAKLAKFFTGKLISQIKGECGHVSPSSEPFVDLPVNVKNKACLPESLDELVQGEPMEGANKYKCLGCDTADGGRLVNAMRRACPDEMPDNLTFCLKRFTFEAMFGMEGKVNDRFEFPQNIDMSRYQRVHLENPTAPVEEDIFELVGVIVHQGTLNLGHYWSYTLLRNTARPDLRTWVKLEDKNVTLVDGGVVAVQQECFGGQSANGQERADNAYVLFYQRQSSLEEQIALPEQVFDPETGLLLPPKVPIDPILGESIHTNNAWAQRIAHLFDEDFALLIEWLLSKYVKSDIASPVDSVLEAPDEDNSTMVESPRDSNTGEELGRRISEAVMTYVKRVAVCNSHPVGRMKRCITALEPLMQRPDHHSLYLLEQIADDPKWYTGLIKHENRMVRNWINNLIAKCSVRLREHDPTAHDDVFTKLRETHSSWITKDKDQPLFDWSSYLKLVSDFAGFGRVETASILEEYYWNWVFEMLAVPFDPEIRKRHIGVFDHMKHNSGNVAALYQFIYNILNGYVDFSSYDRSLRDTEPRRFSEMGVLLRQREFQDLVKPSDDVQVAWLLRAAKLADKGQDWRESAPGKVLGLLVSNKADEALRYSITASLIKHIDTEEESLNTLLHLVIHFYANFEQPDARGQAVFKALVKVVHMWDSYELDFLATVQEVYRYAPCTVLATQDEWLVKLLNHNKVHAVRQATAKWLVEEVYGREVPLSERPNLDRTRVNIARKLAPMLVLHLTNAQQEYRPRARFQPMIDVVLQMGKYMSALQETDDLEVGRALQLEIDESHSATDEIEALETDILEDWSEDAGLPGTGVQEGGGQVGLDEDEELSSDEEWASDDSVIETVPR
ncbi:Ubiquitin carboxyl-terminal hydrolase 13 [Lecanosticta acicola]|uniref:Ubiquitin carboxyl-terminal hydrolase 13 n=1 Tax=Lecanosticta acicola TaxID=111012 RepID=A0AAI8YZE4_9PEZI|nr:Ubiquitin carboxyl-terminal hydrolase 13 [Lecanosticta acicola]